MIRYILFIFLAAILVIVMVPCAIYLKFFAKLKPEGRVHPIVQWILDTFGPVFWGICGTSFDIKGSENIYDGPALWVGNHQGIFDIGLILTKIGPAKSIVAKKEVEKIPGVHMWMQFFDCIFIDRGNPRQSLECLKQCEDLLKNGRSVVIFPEGTRSKGPEMSEFKAGALRSAIKAGVPVIPFAIDDSYKLYEEKKSLTKGTIKLSILPPVYTAEMEKAKTKNLSAIVQQLIQDELYNMRNTPESERTVNWLQQEN